MKTTKTTKMMMIVAVVVVALAIPGVGYGDTVAHWSINGIVPWSTDRTVNGIGSNGYMNLGDTSVTTFNQTGGTITLSATYGMSVGDNYGPAYYNMTNAASFIQTSGGYNLLGNKGAGTWSLTDSASVSILGLNFDNTYHTASKVLLSGSASFTLTALGNLADANDYISFASGSLATLTVPGKAKADYVAWVAAGHILVNELPVSNFDSTFVVDGSTLSLASEAVPEPAGLGLIGLALLALRRRKV